MKNSTFNLIKLEAEEGYVLDWADLTAHTRMDEDENEVQEHLYAKMVYLGINDSADNYVEVKKPE